MIISSILHRERLKLNDTINSIWTPIHNDFDIFVDDLGIKKIYINQLYYGNNIPDIIICNNKIEYYHQCYNISKDLHIPVLLIDHIVKGPLYDNDKVKALNVFYCYHHICISKSVSDSWDLKNAQILSYHKNNQENISIWKNLIFQTAKKIFKIN
jgi:hypothetical protein